MSSSPLESSSSSLHNPSSYSSPFSSSSLLSSSQFVESKENDWIKLGHPDEEYSSDRAGIAAAYSLESNSLSIFNLTTISLVTIVANLSYWFILRLI